jgi:hypothetical protein
MSLVIYRSADASRSYFITKKRDLQGAVYRTKEYQDLKHRVVKDQNRRSVPVMNLVQMAEMYVVQGSDNIHITENGEFSLKTLPRKIFSTPNRYGRKWGSRNVDFRTLSDTMDMEEVMRQI